MEEKMFCANDVKRLYSAFTALCDFVEEEINCGNCPLWESMCGAEDKTEVSEFSEALKRIRDTAGIEK